MYEESVEVRELRNGMVVRLTVSCANESPNDVYGCFERADGHQGGVTVSIDSDYRGPKTHWIPTQTSIAELSREYAKQGRENPSREAYESLQRECEAEVCGNMYTASVTVSLHGVELAADTIGFAWHDNYGESLGELACEMSREHFDMASLVRAARVAAHDLAVDFQAA